MAEKRNDASGAAIAGAGGVAAGTGAVAGGVPGAKSDVAHVKYQGGSNVRTRVRGRAKQAKALPGGIFGFRHNAHAGGIYGFKQKVTENEWKGRTQNAHEAFMRGRDAGKVGPEEVILRHLKGGKRAAGVALAGGAAATAYGVHRTKHPVSKAKRDSERVSGALLGGGAATFGVSHGATKVLQSQEKKWAGAATRNASDAGKLVPGLAGKSVDRRTDAAIKSNPKIFRGVSPETAERAGRLRGAAVQHAHFAHVYGDTAKTVSRLRAPGAVAAGAGGLGLLASRHKSKVKKNLSAFGVEH